MILYLVEVVVDTQEPVFRCLVPPGGICLHVPGIPGSLFSTSGRYLGACFQVFGATRWYPSRVRMVRYGCDDELRMGPIGEDRPKSGGPKWTIQAQKWSKTRFMKNAASMASECKIAKHVKQAIQNHAKGGYHAALSNARIS
jgi:hypothetical protein